MANVSVLAPERIDLESLFQRCLGNLELAERVLQAFEEHFESDLDELERALVAHRWEAAAQLAHRMKGASANVSAVDLANELTQLEEAARAGESAAASCGIQRLREQWDRFQAAEKEFGPHYDTSR